MTTGSGFEPGVDPATRRALLDIRRLLTELTEVVAGFSPSAPASISARSLFGPVAGTYFENGGLGASAHGVLVGAANRMEVAPVVFPRDFAVDRIATRCTTGVAASTIKMIVYASDPTTGWPSTLIHETAALATTTTNTTQEATWAYTFLAGVVYWVGVRHSLTAGLRAIPVAATPSLGLSDVVAANNFTTLRRTLTYATAAPASWGFVAAERTSNILPTAIRFRAA